MSGKYRSITWTQTTFLRQNRRKIHEIIKNYEIQQQNGGKFVLFYLFFCWMRKKNYRRVFGVNGETFMKHFSRSWMMGFGRLFGNFWDFGGTFKNIWEMLEISGKFNFKFSTHSTIQIVPYSNKPWESKKETVIWFIHEILLNFLIFKETISIIFIKNAIEIKRLFKIKLFKSLYREIDEWDSTSF